MKLISYLGLTEKHNVRAFGILGLLTCLRLFGGSMEVLTDRPPGASGFVPLSATIQNTVSLRIEDSSATGSNIVSNTGIHFGNVNNLGTTDTPGIRGSQRQDVGHYEADIEFTVNRSGGGLLTLECRRSSSGTFNARDGVEIENSLGSLSPLSSLGLTSVLVLQNVAPGRYEKTLAINVHPTDRGTLRAVLQFTVCVL